MNKRLSLHDPITHPAHYLERRTIQPLIVIQDWDLSYCLGNVLKSISRAGRKHEALEDLEKALFYLEYQITLLKKERKDHE